jgi:hypothetical protein
LERLNSGDLVERRSPSDMAAEQESRLHGMNHFGWFASYQSAKETDIICLSKSSQSDWEYELI